MRYAPVTGARSGEPPYYCVIPNMAEADSVVSEECIEELLEFFTKGSYKAKSIDRRVSEGKAFRGPGSPLVDGPCR